MWIVDGKKIEKYTGPRSLDDLKAYVEKSAGIVVKRAAEAEPQQVHVKEDEAVLQLTTQNFDHGIQKGVTFVKFFAPWFVSLRPTIFVKNFFFIFFFNQFD